MGLSDIKSDVRKKLLRYRETGQDIDLLAYYKACRALYRYQLRVQWDATTKELIDDAEQRIHGLELKMQGGQGVALLVL